MTSTFFLDAVGSFLVVAVVLLSAAGCGGDVAPANVDATDTRDAQKSENPASIERLIDALEDDSVSVRQAAVRNLSGALNRKIYFDPTASAQERARAIEDVRKTWKNLKERDLVDDVQRRVMTQYYFDLNTGEVFEDASQPGPIETASGSYRGMPAGVRVVMFACQDCGDVSDRYVGWLEVPAAALKQYGIEYVSAPEFDTEVEIKRRRVFRRPGGGEWAIFGTPEAEAIAADGRNCDNRNIPLICRPGR